MFRYGLCLYIDISYSEQLVIPVVDARVGVSDWEYVGVIVMYI